MFDHLVGGEAGALAKRRLGSDAFRALGDVAMRSMHVVWVDRELHGQAWENAARQGRAGPSLVDWVAFLVMRELTIETALALDEHFAEQGFTVLP